MGHQVASLLPDHPVVEVRYFGQVTAADLTEAFTECVVRAMELDTWHLLADCTNSPGRRPSPTSRTSSTRSPPSA